MGRVLGDTSVDAMQEVHQSGASQVVELAQRVRAFSGEMAGYSAERLQPVCRAALPSGGETAHMDVDIPPLFKELYMILDETMDQLKAIQNTLDRVDL